MTDERDDLDPIIVAGDGGEILDDTEDNAGGEPSETRRASSVERNVADRREAAERTATEGNCERSESDGGHVLVRVPRRAGRRRYQCRRCEMISRHRSTFEAVACRGE